MASRAYEITQAVSAYLNAQTFPGLDFTCLAVIDNYLYQEHMDEIVVDVYPVAFTFDQYTRDTYLYNHSIGITLAKAVVQETYASKDQLIELSELIPQTLFNVDMAGATYRDVNGGAANASFNSAQLERASLITAEIDINYTDIVKIGDS